MLISVIVPTHNRAEHLANCLRALARQQFPAADAEVIIIADGCTDRTAAVAAAAIADRPNWRLIETERRGAAGARNTGILAAQGTLIAFTDDDCLPREDWLARIASGFVARPEVLALGGRTVTEQEKVTPLSHWVEDDLPYSFPSCNLAVRRRALWLVGGFDPRFFPNEDWDLTFALQEIGQMAYDPELVVLHPPRPERLTKLVKAVNALDTEFLLAAKHPVAYRRSVHRSPWRVIYYHQFFVQAALKLWRFRKLPLSKPRQFVSLMILLAGQRLYLVCLFPHFLRCRRRAAAERRGDSPGRRQRPLRDLRQNSPCGS